IEENRILGALMNDLDNQIEARNKEIEKLRTLYNERYDDEVGTIYLDEVYVYYKNTLERLKAEQIRAVQAKIALQLELEDIEIATEFEKNRRIKRAAFDNEEDRYINDRAALQNIKKITQPVREPYEVDDFDFGEEQSRSIQILKNVNHIDNGYYLVIAIHNDMAKRNEFITKVVASGHTDVDFFYDVNSSKYYIYHDKFESIEAASKALSQEENEPYNAKMSLVKIEN
ncbi:MAG: hypothetical protein KJO25_01930, partial [Bacteroidia bacterium]|nr:hypothetical protein [Bacteroidia bacterium]